MDPTEIVNEMLTCNICENVGFRKGTTLLLLPKCQHYICETCMHTMRERAAESNQRKIECPFCRVPFSADDEQSTPRFRYADCLADKVLTDGKKKRNSSPKLVKIPGGISKPVLLNEFDITGAQIIEFMQFGGGAVLYTTAGALSREFGNLGIYMIDFGQESVTRFGDLDCRYDGLAFLDGKLFAVNYTLWRLEIFSTTIGQKKWPQWEAAFDLADGRPQNPKIEIQAVVYRCVNGLHLLCTSDHLQFHANLILEVEVTHAPMIQKYERLYLLLANNNEQWYMEGNDLVHSVGKFKRKQKKLALTNWTCVTSYESEKFLYTVKESANVFITHLDAVTKDERPLSTSSLRSTSQNPSQVFIRTTNIIPDKVAASDSGYIALLGHHDDKRVVQLYACQKSTKRKTILRYREVVKIEPEPVAGLLSTVTEKLKRFSVQLFVVVALLMLFMQGYKLVPNVAFTLQLPLRVVLG